jgi:FtsH-binding integral membrane protein
MEQDPKERKRAIRTWTLLLCLAAAICLALYVGTRPVDAAHRTQDLQLSVGYGLLILIFFVGFVILVDLANGNIDLSQLLEEKGSGGASMARFQLLIFTFVIGLSLVYVALCECKIPDIPTNVLTLLGISATTYGVGKGIQATKDDNKSQAGGNGGGQAGGGQAAGPGNVVPR